jgi:anaerobic selenocysteine-containing dehydrogenase
VIVVDPRVIPACRDADQHLALRPGTDLPLALGLIRWFFHTGRADWPQLERWTTGAAELRERAAPWTLARTAEVTGLTAEEIERFALTFAEASPALLRAGWGVERSRCGGSAIAALIALPLVAGKQGVRGGGFSMSQSGALPPLEAQPEPPVRRVNLARLGEALTELRDPPVQVLWVYNCNPLVTVPDQRRVRAGLSRADLFTVVHDAVLTDTARYADLVLPATVFTEHDDLAPSYGAHLMARLRPVTRPPGQARPNAWVFRALEERLGLARPGDTTTPEEEADRLLAPYPSLREALETDGVAGPFRALPVPFVDVHPTTPDQKVHLVPSSLDAEAPLGLYGWQPDPGDEAHPLALITPARADTISSTFGQLAPAAPLEIHPSDAEARGIHEGDAVVVFNTLGTVQVSARLTARVRPGVVSLPKGLWAHHHASPDGPNALIPAGLTDLGAGPAYFDARVQVARA